MLNKGTYGVIIVVPMHFSGFFQVKTMYSKVDFRHIKILDAIFGSIPTIKYYRT